MAQKKFRAGVKTCHFGIFFRMGRDGRALLVRPSRIPHRNWKIIFVLGSYESLEILQGKTREGPFFEPSIWYSVHLDRNQWENFLEPEKSNGNSNTVFSEIDVTKCHWVWEKGVCVRLNYGVCTMLGQPKTQVTNRLSEQNANWIILSLRDTIYYHAQ